MIVTRGLKLEELTRDYLGAVNELRLVLTEEHHLRKCRCEGRAHPVLVIDEALPSAGRARVTSE